MIIFVFALSAIKVIRLTCQQTGALSWQKEWLEQTKNNKGNQRITWEAQISETTCLDLSFLIVWLK